MSINKTIIFALDFIIICLIAFMLNPAWRELPNGLLLSCTILHVSSPVLIHMDIIAISTPTMHDLLYKNITY